MNYDNSKTHYNNYLKSLNTMSLISKEEEKPLFEEIQEYFKSPLLTLTKMNGFVSHTIDLDVLFYSMKNDSKYIDLLKNLLSYFDKCGSYEIYKSYLKHYLSFYEKNNRVPSFEELKELFSNFKYNYFSFDSKKSLDYNSLLKELNNFYKLEKIRKDIMLSYYRMVFDYAKEMNKNVDYTMDFINEGNMGLLTAIERFDPSQGTLFSTYATYWIKAKMSFFKKNNLLIGIPRYYQEEMARYRIEIDKLLENGKTVDDIISKLNINEKMYNDIINGGNYISLDYNYCFDEDDSSTLYGVIKDNTTFDNVENNILNASFYQIFNDHKKMNITQKDYELLELYFGLNGKEALSIKEIADIRKISKQYVHQRIHFLLNKINNSSFKELKLSHFK